MLPYEPLFAGNESTLDLILESREKKVSLLKEIAKSFPRASIISMGVNMPGKVKSNFISGFFFQLGMNTLHENLPKPLYSKVHRTECGPVLFLAYNEDAERLKSTTLSMEKKYPFMRMLDTDVYTTGIVQISRSRLGEDPQKCFVCDRSAKECASRQVHTEREIKDAIFGIFRKTFCSVLGRIASLSLIKEAECTPKPGLVDSQNNGAHKDMNIELLRKSALCLRPYFEEMTDMGFDNCTLSELRKTGKKAEEQMMKITGGINTHKGAVFCLGLMCCCASATLQLHGKLSADIICDYIKQFVHGIEKEVPDEIRKKRGTGARQSACDGYPVLINDAIPYLRKMLDETDENRALMLTLLLLISKTEDANILSRSNQETLKWAQEQARILFEKQASEEQVKILDDEFINKNISPGGSADMLSAAYFLVQLEKLVQY